MSTDDTVLPDTAPEAGSGSGRPAGTLRSNVLGVPSMAFLVLAMAAPLSASATGIALAIGFGNGIGAPGAYLAITLVLCVFAVGFAAMSRHVTNAGAFYAYVGTALGYRLGAAGGYVATLSYNLLGAFVFGISGFYGATALNEAFGIEVPWWLVAFAFLAAAFLLGYLGMEIGAKVAGAILILECVFLLLIDVGVLIQRGPAAFTLSSFSIGEIISGSPGIAFAMIFLAFIGFEATAIFSEEAKNPKRTVGLATMLAVVVSGVLFTLTAWAVVAGYGAGQVVEHAQGPDSGTMLFDLARNTLGPWAGGVFNLLIITSSVAAVSAVHNAASRYLFAMSRSRLAPPKLSSVHPRFHSPTVAGATQACFVTVLLVVWAVVGLDPFADMGVLGTLGAVGVMALQCLASVAIVVFFRRRSDPNWVTTFVAPVVASLCLGGMLVLALVNWPTLVGGSSAVIKAVPLALLAVGAAGYLVAARRGPLPGEFAPKALDA